MGASINLESTALFNLINGKSFNNQSLASLLLFAEGPGHIIVTVPKETHDIFKKHMQEQNILYLGQVTEKDTLEINIQIQENKKQYKWSLSELLNAWKTPLPFA